MKKRILLISPQPFFQWRGSPIRIKFNLLALVELGYQVDLLTLPIGEEEKIAGVDIYRVANPFSIDNIPIGPSLWKIFFDILILFKGFQLCLKNRYSVIHGVEEAGFIGAVLSKLFRVRNIFEKHSDPFSYKKGKLKNLLLHIYSSVEKLTVKMADAVICTGPGLVEQVNGMRTDTKAFNIFDIPSSLHESTKAVRLEKRSELMKDENEVLITYVGSFAVYQGVDLMFNAIPLVTAASSAARFVIIGGSQTEISHQQKIFQSKNCAEKVTFLGKVPPDILPGYLAASDILLSPRGSGVNTPLKILDYLKAGGAIVATDHPSNRLLLDENSASFASPDPENFAETVAALVRDREKRERLGRNGRQIYEQDFTFAHHCQRLSECYGYLGS